MTATLRIAAALAVGTVIGFPTGVVAADDEVVPSGLMIGGQPLAALVRTEPTAPFVAYEFGRASVGAQAEGTEQTDDEGELRRSVLKSVLIGGGIGGGVGLAMGATTCRDEASWLCPYAGSGALAGLAIGAGIGAMIGVLTGP